MIETQTGKEKCYVKEEGSNVTRDSEGRSIPGVNTLLQLAADLASVPVTAETSVVWGNFIQS